MNLNIDDILMQQLLTSVVVQVEFKLLSISKDVATSPTSVK